MFGESTYVYFGMYTSLNTELRVHTVAFLRLMEYSLQVVASREIFHASAFFTTHDIFVIYTHLRIYILPLLASLKLKLSNNICIYSCLLPQYPDLANAYIQFIF